MALTVKEFKMRFAKRTAAINAEKCDTCKTPLRETVTGIRRSGKDCLCSDCYFERLGAHVEKHPIKTGRVRRG